MKAVNQMLAGVHVAMTSEAMAFGMAQGLSPDRVLEVVSQSAGTSWMFENRAPRLIEEDFVRPRQPDHLAQGSGHHPRDLRAAGPGGTHHTGGAGPLPAGHRRGRAHEDDASLVKTYLSEAGLERPESKDSD